MLEVVARQGVWRPLEMEHGQAMLPRGGTMTRRWDWVRAETQEVAEWTVGVFGQRAPGRRRRKDK